MGEAKKKVQLQSSERHGCKVGKALLLARVQLARTHLHRGAALPVISTVFPVGECGITIDSGIAGRYDAARAQCAQLSLAFAHIQVPWIIMKNIY
jgi:hypothetical protein